MANGSHLTSPTGSTASGAAGAPNNSGQSGIPPPGTQSRAISQSLLTTLFDLPPAEQLVQDYACALGGTLLMHGRFYVTSGHFCFFSNLFGSDTKLVIPHSQVAQIRKTTTALVVAGLEITTKNGTKHSLSHFFSGYRDECLEICLKRLGHAMDTSVSPTEANTTPPGSTGMHRPRVASTKDDSEVGSAFGSPRSRAVTAASASSLLSGGSGSGTGTPALTSPNAVAAVVAAAGAGAGAGDPLTSPASAASSENKSSDSLDEEVDVPANFWTEFGNMTELCSDELPLPAGNFFHEFLADDASYSILQLHSDMQHLEMAGTPWSPSPDQVGVKVRTITLRMPIEKAVMGPSSTRVTKNQTVMRCKGGLLIHRSSSISHDVPYGDAFVVDDCWAVQPVLSDSGADTGRCRVTIKGEVKFKRSVFVAGLIRSKSIEGISGTYNGWLTHAKKHLASIAKHKQKASAATMLPPDSLATSDRDTILSSYVQLWASHTQLASTISELKEQLHAAKRAPKKVHHVAPASPGIVLQLFRVSVIIGVFLFAYWLFLYNPVPRQIIAATASTNPLSIPTPEELAASSGLPPSPASPPTTAGTQSSGVILGDVEALIKQQVRQQVQLLMEHQAGLGNLPTVSSTSDSATDKS